MGTRQDGEAVLTCIHNQCVWLNYQKYHFFPAKLSILTADTAWTRFCNVQGCRFRSVKLFFDVLFRSLRSLILVQYNKSVLPQTILYLSVKRDRSR